MAELTDAQRRELLLKAVAEADLNRDDQAKMQAQWDLVASLVNAGLHEEAFQQAMKLRTVNAQSCMESLKTIAEDAIKRGDQATVRKAWDAAKRLNADSGTKFNHHVIELGFQLNLPDSEMLAVARAAKREDKVQAYSDILHAAEARSVVEQELAIAEQWIGRIDDSQADTSVEQLEQQFLAIDSRDGKFAILRNIFRRLLEEGRIEEADLILPREVQLVKEQPRPELKSKFDNVNDEDGIRMTTWRNNAAIVRALHKAGRIDEAKARLEAMKDLPNSEAFFLLGNLAETRLQLYMEFEDFDAVDEFYEDKLDAVGEFKVAAWLMKKGRFDRGWKHVTPFLEMSFESMFPLEVRAKNSYAFAAKPFAELARELFKANHADAALKIISKLPESRDITRTFETFGELLVSNGHAAELEQWIARLPHETAKTHARMGALREITKTKE